MGRPVWGHRTERRRSSRCFRLTDDPSLLDVHGIAETEYAALCAHNVGVSRDLRARPGVVAPGRRRARSPSGGSRPPAPPTATLHRVRAVTAGYAGRTRRRVWPRPRSERRTALRQTRTPPRVTAVPTARGHSRSTRVHPGPHHRAAEPAASTT